MLLNMKYKNKTLCVNVEHKNKCIKMNITKKLNDFNNNNRVNKQQFQNSKNNLAHDSCLLISCLVSENYTGALLTL